MATVVLLGEEMTNKISISDHTNSKKTSSVSIVSTSSNEDPPRKKSSLKENLVNALRSPNFLLRREATKLRWDAMRERLKLNRIKISSKYRKTSKSRERRRRSTENATVTPSIPPASPRLSPNEWQFAFDHVIFDTDGRAQFTKFLQSEYSEENILFWWAVEELKAVAASEGRAKFEQTVQEMFDTFIAAESPLAINIDHDTRTDIIERVENKEPSTFPENIYERAQAHVYRLMEKDCFSRFVHTTAYKDVAKKLSLPQTFRFNGRLSPAT